VLLQLFAYYVGPAQARNLGRPRNLARTIAVE